MIVWEPITLYEFLSTVISVLGFFAVIVSLFYVARQTRHATKSLTGNLYTAASRQTFTIDKVFIDQPKLRPYFYSGKDISEDDPAYEQVIAVADLIHDFFDYILIQAEKFPELFPRHSWEGYIVDTFENSPILCRHLDNVKDRAWHSDDLMDLMRTGEAQRSRFANPNTYS